MFLGTPRLFGSPRTVGRSPSTTKHTPELSSIARAWRGAPSGRFSFHGFFRSSRRVPLTVTLSLQTRSEQQHLKAASQLCSSFSLSVTITRLDALDPSMRGRLVLSNRQLADVPHAS